MLGPLGQGYRRRQDKMAAYRKQLGCDTHSGHLLLIGVPVVLMVLLAEGSTHVE